MRARFFWSKTTLALAGWAVLSLSVLAQATGQGNQSPEQRWGKDIRAFEAADKTNPPPRGAILFIGSSTVRLWTNLAEAFPGHQVINRGFGGSQLSDSVAFVDRIVTPYRPKLVFLYAGDNDIVAGKTPERIMSAFKAFVEQIHSALPATRIAYLAIKPCPAREKFLAQVKTTNRLIREYVASNDQLLFIDTFTPMLTADGRPRADVYLKDGLHPNARGYGLWVPILTPILDKYDPSGEHGRQP